MMLNNVHYRSSRNKMPVYTSDKRAKFTQRENKKWIRLATVFGYIISVSTPAIILSIYYIFFWRPDYATRFPANLSNAMNEAGYRNERSVKDSNMTTLPQAQPATPMPVQSPDKLPFCKPCNCQQKTPQDTYSPNQELYSGAAEFPNVYSEKSDGRERNKK